MSKLINTQANIPLFIAARFENRNDYDREIWVTLPVTKEHFSHAVMAVCDSWDDFALRGYFSTLPELHAYNLMKMPFSVVNFLAARLKKLNDEQALKLMMAMESDYDFRTAEQVIDFTYRPDKYELLPNVLTYWQLGEHRKSGLDMKALPPALIDCICTEDFGISSAFHEDGKFTPLGYLSAKNASSKAPRKRDIPACWDIKGKDGEEIYGKWFSDEEFDCSGHDYFDDEESEDDV